MENRGVQRGGLDRSIGEFGTEGRNFRAATADTKALDWEFKRSFLPGTTAGAFGERLAGQESNGAKGGAGIRRSRPRSHD
jgi:hypothetical protein